MNKVFQMDNIWIFACSVCLGYAGAFFMSKVGGSLGFADMPNRRSSHNVVVPKGGAMGIFFAFVLAGLIFKMSIFFMIGVTLISVVSLLADKYNISSVMRLMMQFFCAGLLIFDRSTLPQDAQYGLWIVLAVIFMVGTANFYNFMDGINGIAGIAGVIAFGLIGFYAINYSGNDAIGFLAVCISLACLGFLPLNFPKAKVFMGDIGSIMLGFVFSGLVLWLSKSFSDIVCLSSFIFPFYADELVTMYTRIRKKKDLLKPHRRHFYQILTNQKGVPHWKVSVLYGIMQLVVGVSVLLLRPLGMTFVVLALSLYFVVFVCANFIVRAGSDKKAVVNI